MPSKPASAPPAHPQASKRKVKIAPKPTQEDEEYVPEPDPPREIEMAPPKTPAKRSQPKAGGNRKPPRRNTVQNPLNGLGPMIDDFSSRSGRPADFPNEDLSDDEPLTAKQPGAAKRSAPPTHDARPSKKPKEQPPRISAPETSVGEELRSLASRFDSQEQELSHAVNEVAHLRELLDRKDRDMEALKIELYGVREDRKESKKLVKQLTSNFNSLQKERETSQRTSEKLYQHLKQENHELKQRIEKLELLPEALSRERARAEKFQKAFESLRAEHVELVSQQEQDADYFNDKTSDDTIIREWKVLISLIHQLATQVLVMDPTDRKLPSPPVHAREVESLLAAWTGPHGPTPLYVHVEKFIWSRIHEDILLGGEKVWGGQVGFKFLEFVQSMHDKLEDAEKLSFIKGRASQLLNPIFETWENNANKRMLGNLTKDLAIFIDPDRLSQFQAGLTEILDKAIQLHRTFMMSRAYFMPKLIGETVQRFNEDKMETRYSHADPEKQPCDICVAISPMIVKIGSADGFDFKARHVLCKAVVTVKPAASSPSSICEIFEDDTSTTDDASIEDEPKQFKRDMS